MTITLVKCIDEQKESKPFMKITWHGMNFPRYGRGKYYGHCLGRLNFPLALSCYLHPMNEKKLALIYNLLELLSHLSWPPTGRCFCSYLGILHITTLLKINCVHVYRKYADITPSMAPYIYQNSKECKLKWH